MTKQQNTDAKKMEDFELKTLKAIFKGQKVKVKKLYGNVKHLFDKGRFYTRTFIANKFIFPLSQLLEINYRCGHEYLNLFPHQIKAEYCGQINLSGI